MMNLSFTSLAYNLDTEPSPSTGGAALEYRSILEGCDFSRVTPCGVSVALRRVGGEYELVIERDGARRVEAWPTRADALGRAGALMGRVSR